jgi:hypothetical protein
MANEGVGFTAQERRTLQVLFHCDPARSDGRWLGWWRFNADYWAGLALSWLEQGVRMILGGTPALGAPDRLLSASSHHRGKLPAASTPSEATEQQNEQDDDEDDP